jgi:hypothetical protein
VGYIAILFHLEPNATLSTLAIIMMKKTKFEEWFGLTDRASAVLVGLTGAAFAANLGAVGSFVLPRLGKLGFLRLHYTSRLGVDWIDDWWMIFTFPVVGLIIFFLNGWLAGQLARRHRSLGHLVHTYSAVVETILAVAAIIAVVLNR